MLQPPLAMHQCGSQTAYPNLGNANAFIDSLDSSILRFITLIMHILLCLLIQRTCYLAELRDELPIIGKNAEAASES